MSLHQVQIKFVAEDKLTFILLQAQRKTLRVILKIKGFIK